jgi:hypothetical protein
MEAAGRNYRAVVNTRRTDLQRVWYQEIGHGLRLPVLATER